jgi:hypothetical protein
MLGGLIANSVNAAFSQTETFDGNGRMDAAPGHLALVSFLTVTIIFLILLFFGKYLWNNVLVTLIPAIKPAKSVWQILGFAILLSLLSPGSCTCGA